MTSTILQIASLQVTSVAHDNEGVSCNIIGLALVDESGVTRVRYIQHGTDGKPELTPDNYIVVHANSR